MRTKECFRILPGTVRCTKVLPIWIHLNPGGFAVIIDGQILDRSEREALAVADGFPDFRAMMKFWEGRLPFKGFIIHWKP